MKEQVKKPFKYDVQAQKKFIDVHIRTIQTTRNQSAIIWGADLDMMISISESLKGLEALQAAAKKVVDRMEEVYPEAVKEVSNG
jgi:hypothetical protein